MECVRVNIDEESMEIENILPIQAAQTRDSTASTKNQGQKASQPSDYNYIGKKRPHTSGGPLYQESHHIKFMQKKYKI